MPFPIVPVLVTAGLGSLGYLLFKPETPASNASSGPNPQNAQNGGSGALGENSNPAKQPKVPSNQNLPPAKRPKDLPKPIPIPSNNNFPVPPLPIPIPPNVRPDPSPLPAPAPLPIPIPTPVTPTDQTGLVVAPSGVNLRNGPTTSAAVLTGMTVGTRVKILEYLPTPTAGAPKGWYRVTAPNGMTGYGTAEFILPDNGSNPVPVPVPIPNVVPVPNVLPNILPAAGLQGRILGQPGANMRSSPSTSGAIVKGLFNGTIVTVMSPTLSPATAGAPKGWVNVKDASGATGWVSREFCEPIIPGSFGMDPFGADRDAQYRKRSRIRG